MNERSRGDADRVPRVCVFAPEFLPDGGGELHVHAGGQGFWIARMARILGARVHLCGGFGGETGAILHDLMIREGLVVRAVRIQGSNGAYIGDRRRGTRTAVADIAPAALRRHEAGADTVVVSRAHAPALVLSAGSLPEVVPPPLHAADPAGAGDSMTAGIAVGLARGLDLDAALELGAAAGSVNAMRDGVATRQRHVVARLASKVVIRTVTESALR
ncbi:hypothetical protein GCM10023094_48020 [Rhodococcus olei]|uniref:Carbohydrate kinase PfkB domain-containing protein n=1 Tax=Rhodococcus olei TaxID=2161675 RepID=A0ABP8PLG9_9NOCA